MARLLGLLAVSACSFNPPSSMQAIDARPLDAPPDVPPDSGGCESAATTCSDALTLRTCPAANAQPVLETCAWGCLDAPTAHCGVLEPAGGGVTSADLAADAALTDVTNLSGTIDTTNGAISGLRGPGNGVINGIGFEVRNNVAVFRFKNLQITGTLAPGGANAVAFVATGNLTVGSLIDVRGACTSAAGGPGGSPGGATRVNGGGTGGGFPGAGTHDNSSGGGGAGHGVIGAAGGNTVVTGQPGIAFGDPGITTLVGGSGGGGGGGLNGGGGGGGGGAIQLVANGTIMLIGTSIINAGGCGGRRSATQDDGGGGGGAGGTILMEAPTIRIGASTILAVNGGGGGGGDSNGQSGSPGQPTRTAASGGSGRGGDGGAPGQLSGVAGGVNNGNGGGGGGATGRIRFNTLAGAVDLTAGAILSPALGDTPTTATQGTANVQ